MRITTGTLALIAKFISGASVRWIDCQPDTCQRVYFANHTSHLDALLMGASLVLEVQGETENPEQGVAVARAAIDDGRAKALLRKMREHFQGA